MRSRAQAGAAVALLFLCLPLFQARAATKAEMEQKIKELEQKTEELSRQLDEMNVRLEMIMNRLESLETGPKVAPAEASRNQEVKAATGTPPPNLEVIRLKPEKEPSMPSTAPVSSAANKPPPRLRPTPWPEEPILRVGDVEVAGPAVSNKVDSAEDESDIMGLYHEGLKAYEEKNFKVAVQKFEEFISEFNGEKNIDGAYFWLGESYNNLGEKDKAVNNFETVTESYPESPKAPEALFKIGLIYLEQDDDHEALKAFRNLTILYPFSDLVDDAEEKLKQIGSRD